MFRLGVDPGDVVAEIMGEYVVLHEQRADFKAEIVLPEEVVGGRQVVKIGELTERINATPVFKNNWVFK